MHALAQDASPRKNNKKRAKWTATPRRKRATLEHAATYHYIGYVASKGHVWEMDGLSAGPIDLGELQSGDNPFSEIDADENWLDIASSAIQTRMAHCLGRQSQSTEDGIEGLEFNLLAIIDSKYGKASDRLQACQREYTAIGRRLLDLQINDWGDKVCSPLETKYLFLV
jgi:ubiquitin carboxyl-terminal hydrolase L5